MNYIDVLRESEDMVTPGMSACQGCGGELILRTVLQVAGKNTIIVFLPAAWLVLALLAGTIPMV